MVTAKLQLMIHTMTIAVVLQMAPLNTGITNVKIWHTLARTFKVEPKSLKTPKIPANRRMSWASRRYALPRPDLNLKVGEERMRPAFPKNLELTYMVIQLPVALDETVWLNNCTLAVTISAVALLKGAWAGPGVLGLLGVAARAVCELKKMLEGKNGGGGKKRNWS